MFPSIHRGFNRVFSSPWVSQVRFYYKANDGVLPRRDSRRTLSKTRRELSKPTSGSTSVVLLPPHVAPGELRILLGIDYKSALSLCGVKMYQQKFYWSDPEGRWFETSNKRKVLVPFDQVTPSVKLFGLTPVLVDPEPLLPVKPESGRIPVAAVLGSSLTSFGVTLDNPFGIQSPGFNLAKSTLLCLSRSSSRPMIGRSVVNADVVVAVSGFDIDPDLLDLANKYSVPIVFCDLDDVDSILKSVASAPLVVGDASPSGVDPQATRYAKEVKRTDTLVEAEKGPVMSGVILDVEKTAQQGTTAVVLVKRGVVRLGQFFVAGSGFGRVTNVWTVAGEKVESAVAGQVVKIGKIIKNKEYTGDFAPDDFCHVFSRERAWRLAFQRQRLEWLNTFQTDGRALEAPFEMDSGLVNNLVFSPPETDHRVLEAEVEVGRSGQQSILVEPEEAAVAQAREESEKVMSRWTRRQEQRKRAREDKERLAEQERLDLHKMRIILHTGGPGESQVDRHVEPPRRHAERESQPSDLPERKPVIPLIVKSGSVSEFDAVLDELELLESAFAVKLPIVHGGIGPVTATDAVHAEIESKYFPCKVFAINTSVLPGIDGEMVVELASVDDLIAEVRSRIVSLKTRARRSAYSKTLAKEGTSRNRY